MKIGFVLDDSLDKADGVQQYILTLSKWYALQGHEVHFLVGETKSATIAGGTVHSLSKNVKVRFNGNRMSMPLPTSKKRIKRCLAELQLDVIHVQMPFSPFMAARVIRAADRRTAVIATFHIAPYSRLVNVANRILALLVRSAVKRCDTIVSVSTAAAEFARQGYKIETAVIPNAVSEARYKLAAQTTPATKKIVFLGRLVPRKGCQILLQAVAELKQSGQLDGWQVEVAGPGPLEAELKQYVAEHNLTHNVTFLGFLHEDDKPSFLAGASLAVFPSRGGESFGIVLIEAMASQNPVVLAGDNPGYHSVLRERPDQLFSPLNSQLLAEKMQTFMTDPIAAADARDWQAKAVLRYDVAQVGEQLLAVYEQSLQRRRT